MSSLAPDAARAVRLSIRLGGRPDTGGGERHHHGGRPPGMNDRATPMSFVRK